MSVCMMYIYEAGGKPRSAHVRYTQRLLSQIENTAGVSVVRTTSLTIDKILHAVLTAAGFGSIS